MNTQRNDNVSAGHHNTFFIKMETNLPNNNTYEIKVKHTNSKYCRFCIRLEIPKLIKDNYLPGKVLEKIKTHSYSGFMHYAQDYIISEYESIQCVVFEIVTYAMIEYIFELPLNNYAISTLISLTSYDSKWWLIYNTYIMLFSF